MNPKPSLMFATSLIHIILISMVKSIPIIGVGPFLNDDRFSQCVADLREADSDGDGNVNQHEYAEFISLYSDGKINTTFVGLQNYTLAFVNLFYSHACVRNCEENGFIAVLPTIYKNYRHRQCCEGDELYVHVGEDSINSLFYICAYTDQYIRKSVATDEPTSSPTVIPTPTQTSLPSIVPSLFPSISSSFKPTVEVSNEPTVAISNEPTKNPTISPTEKQSKKPSNSPTEYPTVQHPTKSPTLNPSLTPTYFPSYTPTFVPSMFPSISPTTSEPSKTPTDSPTTTPTFFPTISPSIHPTTLPSSPPSFYPSESIIPTAFGKKRTEYAYQITVVDVDAEDVLTANNNTIMEDLIQATTVIVQRILETGYPCPTRNRSLLQKNTSSNIYSPPIHYLRERIINSHQLSKKVLRSLAEYRSTSPVEILSILDVDCEDNVIEINSDYNCLLVRSAVTIYCVPEEAP